jgi:predicted kinase
MMSVSHTKLGSNKLIILCGIPFAGKSTLARKLVQQCGYTSIDLDEIKVGLYGKQVQDSDLRQADWDRVYHVMYNTIERELRRGETVIHDTGNFTRKERTYASKIAQALDIPYTTVFVKTPVQVAHQRLRDNQITQSRFDVPEPAFRSAVAEMEPPTVDENPIVYDTTTTSDEDIIHQITR